MFCFYAILFIDFFLFKKSKVASTMLVLEAIELFFLFSALYATGATFMRLIFVHNINSIGSRHLFSIVFTLSGTMFLLVLIDLAGDMSPFSTETIRLTLSLAMPLLLLLSALVAPLLSLNSLLGDFGVRRRWLSVVLSVILLIIVYIFSFKSLPSLETMSEQAQEVAQVHTLWELVLAKASIFGVVLMGLLSGFAAVATPVAYLSPYLVRNTKETAKEVAASLARRQAYVLSTWAQKRSALALAKCSQPQSTETGFKWLKKKIGFGGSPHVDQLLSECAGFEKVSLSLFLQSQEAETMQVLSDAGKSYKGIIFAFYGVILSLYCIGKTFWTTVNLVLSRFSMVDPVTRAIQLLTIFTGWEIDVAVSQLALVFNTLMVISAIRGFLIMLFRLTSSYLSAVGGNTTVLFFSAWSGLYFIAMLLLMRLSFPQENRSVITEVIGPLPYTFFHRLYDVIFVVACGITYLIRKVLLTVEIPTD